MRTFSYLQLLVLLLLSGGLFAQKVTYTEPERDDYKSTEFEIIGKVGSNILVYKANKSDYAISVYDNAMQLKDRVTLDFLPKKLISVDFISYADKAYMIYQFQRKDAVYSFAATFNSEGQFDNAPVMIDSTRVGYSTKENKVYSVQVSEDKSKIMVYKINQDKEDNNVFYTFLYDHNLNLINNSRLGIAMHKRLSLNNFNLTNDGNFIFTQLERTQNRDYTVRGAVVIKKPKVDSFEVVMLNTNTSLLDDLRLKVNNSNSQVTLVAFYYKQKKGNVEGLYIGKFDYTTAQVQYERLMAFGQDLKSNAKGEASTSTAFNDYFIRQIVNTNDGGFLITAESYYTTSRYQPWNRWNYMYGGGGGYYPGFYNPYGFGGRYYNPYYWNDSQGNRYHYDNIVILSVDGEGSPVWSNVIRKSQYDDNADLYLSYMMVNVGSELRFLYNDLERRSYVLTDNSISPDGKLNRLPLLRNLDKGFSWMPQYGKQIGARSVLIPVVYRNYICFAKIDF
ncbi:hypothetical protein LX64_03103 [Chitinophaga skermanii]|uniref:Uncharacterized protein n=1 Tax=Chitinophaga skermanii TaxID=331697 RepID=A0A327QKI7_9BACT|nr:hypothetical protein [Chitinophaga skermanii]RAJ04224.1 hypothetical protein LX64_03103 [Chitinophaga skermanii]